MTTGWLQFEATLLRVEQNGPAKLCPQEEPNSKLRLIFQSKERHRFYTDSHCTHRGCGACTLLCS